MGYQFYGDVRERSCSLRGVVNSRIDDGSSRHFELTGARGTEFAVGYPGIIGEASHTALDLISNRHCLTMGQPEPSHHPLQVSSDLFCTLNKVTCWLG